MYAHNAGPDLSQAYQNTVLVKNWYEDRFQTEVAQSTGRTLKELPTKERVVPAGFPGQWETTKVAADTSRMTSPPVAKVAKPSMYSEDNLAERLTTYGLSDKLSYTLGPNAVTEAAKPDRRYFETTNKAMYEDKPTSDKTAHPERFQNEVPSKFGKTDFCMKQLTGEPSDQPPSAAGGKGNRGEITRRPGESGNPYGVSVFVDEYATWGTAIKGMPLTETVDRKQTKYFPK